MGLETLSKLVRNKLARASAVLGWMEAPDGILALSSQFPDEFGEFVA